MLEQAREELKFKFNPADGSSYDEMLRPTPAYWFGVARHTNNMIFNPYTGKLRLQADYDSDAMGVNVVIDYVQARSKLCKDEGCDHHGAEHVCVNNNIDPNRKDSAPILTTFYPESGQLRKAFQDAVSAISPKPPAIRYEKIKYGPFDGRVLPVGEQRPFEKWRKANPTMEVRYDPFTGMPYGGKVSDERFLNRYMPQELPTANLVSLARTTGTAAGLRDKVMSVVEALLDNDPNNESLSLLAGFLGDGE